MKKKSNWQQWIGMGLYLLVGALCGSLISIYVIDRNLPEHLELLTMLGMLLGLFAILFFHTVIHELGHLIFGLLTGYRFSSFRVGSLMWIKINGKIACKRYSLVGTGGQCLMIPPNVAKGKFPVVWYNLGGAVVNLIAALAFFVGYLLLSKANPLSLIFLMGALIGLATALANGIPLKLGDIDNDGRNALSLRKNPASTEAFRLQLVINDAQSQGMRLGEMPEEWFPLPPVEAMDNGLIAAQGVLYCNRLMDLHRFEEAAQLMDRLLAADIPMLGIHQEILRCDRTYCELIGENRWSVIEGLRTKSQLRFLKAMGTSPSALRTEYAYALLGEQDEITAQKKLDQFEKAASRYPYPSEIAAEQELIDIAKAHTPSTP